MTLYPDIPRIIIYLWLLTIGTVVYLLTLRVIYVTQLKSVYDHVGYAKVAGRTAVGICYLIVDFLSDTFRYILVAVLISAISALVYIFALFRPSRWKAYSLLILGVGLCWTAIVMTPENFTHNREFAKWLANDKYSILFYTLFAIGHLYIATSVIQFWIAIDDPEYWYDVWKEREAIRKRKREEEERERNEEVVASITTLYKSSLAFREFFGGLDYEEKCRFVTVCTNALNAKFPPVLSELPQVVFEEWPSHCST